MRQPKSIAAAALIAAAVCSLVGAGSAVADVHVPRGDAVNELRVLGQDVRVDGRARGPILVVGGNLTVGASGEVANITVIAGKFQAAAGARVHGDVFQLGGPLPDLSGWLLTLVLLGLLATRTLLIWLALLASEAIARNPRLAPLTNGLTEATARTLLTGALGSLGALALSILAALTVIGLPIALMIWGALLVALLAGLAATLSALAIGPQQRRGIFLALAIPAIGDALLALTLAAGLGALLRWFGGSRRNLESVAPSLH